MRARRRTRRAARRTGRIGEAAPTFGDAVDAWLTYLEVEKLRKKSTVQDARNVAQAKLLPRFGADTPLYEIERQEVVVRRDGRQYVELREERRDTFTPTTSTSTAASCSPQICRRGRRRRSSCCSTASSSSPSGAS